MAKTLVTDGTTRIRKGWSQTIRAIFIGVLIVLLLLCLAAPSGSLTFL